MAHSTMLPAPFDPKKEAAQHLRRVADRLDETRGTLLDAYFASGEERAHAFMHLQNFVHEMELEVGYALSTLEHEPIATVVQ